jgi:Ran GTPase-activating protein (RanGAP) involved in mRNA processing and transport
MNAQALCDKLVANDAALTELVIILELFDDAELKLVLEAAKKNKTVKKVRLDGNYDGCTSFLTVPAALSLASVVSEHPEIQQIEFNMLECLDFGPIALAIQQNRKLTRLQLQNCRVPPNLVECIRWLLTENALESMTLQTIFTERHPPYDIYGALFGNSSLKELVLQDYNGDVIGSETFQAIPHMIRTSQVFETINLILSDTMTDRYEFVGLVAQAAEGHASLNKLAINYYSKYQNPPLAQDLINHVGTAEAIGTMLHNSPALRELSLLHCYMGSAGARHLADGLSSMNSVVEKLDLSRNMLGDEEASIFARVLLANQNLKSLQLNNNDIGDAGAVELAVVLRHNNTLDFLNLWANLIGSDGASALAKALVANDALKDLELGDNSICDDGATSIAEMLTRNESIEKVCIGGFGEKGLMAFAMRLSSMNGLKTLKVDNGITRGYTSEIGNSFVLALEQNTTLETFDFAAMRSDIKVIPQVDRLLALNRGGRRLLTVTGESVPPLNYWPHILAKSSDNADVLFHFLREIPNVLVEKAGSRKRKRGSDDDTTSTM